VIRHWPEQRQLQSLGDLELGVGHVERHDVRRGTVHQIAKLVEHMVLLDQLLAQRARPGVAQTDDVQSLPRVVGVGEEAEVVVEDGRVDVGRGDEHQPATRLGKEQHQAQQAVLVIGHAGDLAELALRKAE
jgi:hypothetical protein